MSPIFEDTHAFLSQTNKKWILQTNIWAWSYNKITNLLDKKIHFFLS